MPAQVLEHYNAIYETYGRQVRLVDVDASGPTDDDAAARADAIKIADDIGAFAVLSGPGGTNAYAEELAARGHLLCLASQPQEVYEDLALTCGAPSCPRRRATPTAPTTWPTAWPAAGRVRGRSAMQDQEREFAIVYYETADGAYEAGVDFFEERLGEDGVELADRIPYVLDLARAQENAATVIARLKDRASRA